MYINSYTNTLLWILMHGNIKDLKKMFFPNFCKPLQILSRYETNSQTLSKYEPNFNPNLLKPKNNMDSIIEESIFHVSFPNHFHSQFLVKNCFKASTTSILWWSAPFPTFPLFRLLPNVAHQKNLPSEKKKKQFHPPHKIFHDYTTHVLQLRQTSWQSH